MHHLIVQGRPPATEISWRWRLGGIRAIGAPPAPCAPAGDYSLHFCGPAGCWHSDPTPRWHAASASSVLVGTDDSRFSRRPLRSTDQLPQPVSVRTSSRRIAYWLSATDRLKLLGQSAPPLSPSIRWRPINPAPRGLRHRRACSMQTYHPACAEPCIRSAQTQSSLVDLHA
jgi:hypothetical protein